jgi:hypothetical protein
MRGFLGWSGFLLGLGCGVVGLVGTVVGCGVVVGFGAVITPDWFPLKNPL